MYTQCPECKVAFRITAEVLQQARGQVRCGSCGDAFNALDHLSESPPPRATNAPSARQPGEEAGSRALMDTLNRLAGPENVRIEDTGIEWRVVDREDAGVAESDDGDESDAGAQSDVSADSGQSAADDAEPRYDDNTPLPEDFFDDNPEPPPEETPRRRATDFEFVGTEFDNDAQAELELSEPEDWTDLLDEVADDDAVDDSVDESVGHDDKGQNGVNPADSAGIPELDDAREGAESGDEDDFYDSELSLVTDENGDIGIVSDETSDADDGETLREGFDADAAPSVADDTDDDEYAWDDELDDAAGVDDETLPDDDGRSDTGIDVAVIDEEDVDEYELETAADESLDDAEEAEALDHEPEDSDEEPAGRDEVDDRRGGDDHRDTATDTEDADAQYDDGPDDFAAMTANMQIDPDVLKAMRDGSFDATITSEDGSPLVETIIMEGDFVQDSLDEATRSRRALDDTDPESLLDTYITSRASEKRGFGGRIYTGIGVVALLLGLVVQYVHSEREYLATFDLFSNTIGPIYRSVGMPVTPDWDIKGWQFEATSGSTGEDDALLTVTSRISNRSSQGLPYPLVHISLTDRYEEIIGSSLVEPADYLAGGTDPRDTVPPGDSFTATITISSTSADATGFKLNVCYREVGSRVRCAIEDFKEP